MEILNHIRFVLFCFEYIYFRFIKKIYLHDSDGRLINKIGPNSAECRQLIIKDMTKGIYFYVLEIQLANSKKSITTKPMKIECGRESRAPLLTCDYTDLDNRKQLINMAYRLINIRDK